ncbi:hypothetical protein [Candidatus Odyssella thessalonicensis]|uniref:hypothetical protein n=1 Tax=Candidatus Odyssella thessalonicensis TaxID=84647 RepID=UPI000225AA09|nr:hypothetical protein [Candidatus Odyssella thessalonicensis]
MTNNKRLTILTSEEITDLYGIPSFDDDERAAFFSLESVERHCSHKPSFFPRL